MKASELWKQYQVYTRDITENLRKLSLGVAAICWFFKDSNYSFPPAILGCLLVLVLYFALDIIQYSVAAYRYYCFTRDAEVIAWKHGKREKDPEIDVPDNLDLPSRVLLALKTTTFFIACGFLIAEFIYRLVK
ncbi:MAG: hypothetical protein ABR936_15445 [Bacteroidota bacterium]|jgi:hypothetical protein